MRTTITTIRVAFSLLGLLLWIASEMALAKMREPRQ